MSRSTLVAAAIAVLLVSILLTAVGIEERVARAQHAVTPALLAQRFHRGEAPCLRWIDGAEIAPAQTATVAARLVALDLDRRAPEVLALAWLWTREAESSAHTAPAEEEVTTLILEALSPIDRAWLRSVGRRRLEALAPPPEPADLITFAERVVMPPNAKEPLRILWSSSPGPLVRPADTRLVEALITARRTADAQR